MRLLITAIACLLSLSVLGQEQKIKLERLDVISLSPQRNLEFRAFNEKDDLISDNFEKRSVSTINDLDGLMILISNNQRGVKSKRVLKNILKIRLLSGAIYTTAQLIFLYDQSVNESNKIKKVLFIVFVGLPLFVFEFVSSVSEYRDDMADIQ
jgi:hypothetical protein